LWLNSPDLDAFFAFLPTSRHYLDIRDHEKALADFRRAKSEFSSDPDVKVYIDETIPVLESHLKMAQNLHRDDKVMGSRENAANNKRTD
jgi:hypothetical protein